MVTMNWFILYVILELCLDHWEVLFFSHWHWLFQHKTPHALCCHQSHSAVIIVTCQWRKLPALAPMAYFWKELHGFTMISRSSGEKGRVGEQQEKKSFQSGWADWTPCCSGQARVPVTSCPTLILSAKFPEDNSCRCLQTSVSAHSTQGCMPSPLFHEVLIFFLLTRDENARISCFPDSYLVDNHRWDGQTLAISRASLPGCHKWVPGE